METCRPRPRPRRIATLAALVLVALPALASAETVEATATTRLSGRQDVRDGVVHTVVPAFEDVWISARDFKLGGIEDVKVIVQAWGEIVGGDPLGGDAVTGDVDIGYVEGRALDRHLDLRLGRQLLSAGVARNLHLDGLRVVGRAGPGLGLEAYGGVPVAPRFGSLKGKGAVGGRIFWHPAARFEGGVSFVHVVTDEEIDRQEAGVDGRLRIIDELSVSGLAAFSIVEKRLVESNLRLLWQPTRSVEVGVEGGRTAPDLFVSRASIFSVFSEEKRDEAGLTLYLRPLPRLRLYGDGYVISEESGTGGRADLRATLALGQGNGTSVGLEGHALYVPANGYFQTRAFATRRFATKLTATLDVDTYFIRDNVNAQSTSFTGAATLGWDFAPGWKCVATAIAGETPFIKSRFEAMGKLVYNFDLHATEVAK